MPQITYKPLGAEQALSTSVANTVSNASLVRLINTSTGVAVLTFANSGGQYGNITLLVGQEYVFKKNQTDTILSTNTLVLATPIAYLY